jgi:hypothetical protein
MKKKMMIATMLHYDLKWYYYSCKSPKQSSSKHQVPESFLYQSMPEAFSLWDKNDDYEY